MCLSRQKILEAALNHSVMAYVCNPQRWGRFRGSRRPATKGGGVVVRECVVASAEATEIEFLLADGTRALNVEGNLLASREEVEAAYQQAERIGDASAIAEAALGLGGLWVHEHRTLARSTQVQARLRHALSL